MTSLDTDATIIALEEFRTGIEAAMRDHMGNATYCQLHKDGRVSGGLKYEEGRLVVAGWALRLLRREGATALHVALPAERATWAGQLHKHQNTQPLSMPWVAYTQGGVDGLAQIVTLLDA